MAMTCTPNNYDKLLNMQGVQLLIHARDKDSGNDSQYIVAFAVNIEQPVNSSQSRVARTPITLNLSITVLCLQNFQGPDCAEVYTWIHWGNV